MDFEKIIDNLSPKTKKEFDEVSSYLEDNEGSSLEESFENRVAQLLLTIMSETQYEENPIMRTSYLIANTFSRYSFDYRIRRALEVFNELQIPLEFQEGREFEMWDKAKEYLLKFLEDEDLEDDSVEEDLDLDFDADN